MRTLDHLQIAITHATAAQLLTIAVREFSWGPAQETLAYVEGHVFGRIEPSAWTCKPWLAAATSDLVSVSLWPMVALPRGVEPPSPADFAAVLGKVLTASDVWFLWCEPDFDQRPVPEEMMTAEEVSRSVQQCLEGPPVTYLLSYSPSAARRRPGGAGQRQR